MPRLTYQYFCKSCDLVIAPSQGMREVLKRFGVDDKVIVVPNGVDLSPFQKDVVKINREYLGFKQDDIILIYTGRLGPEKNLTFLLRAFAGIAKTYPQTQLLLVGNGPVREDLEELVRIMGIMDRVHFTGMLPYHDLPAYLGVADAFVTASVTEVHPLSVIEAMAAGLPVLGIRSPGVGDTIEDEVTGIIVGEEDVAEFTAKLARLISEPEKRKEMGSKASLAARAYSIENTTHLLLEQYQYIIAETAGKKLGLRARVTLFRDHWLR
jgi:1,2-diacylglycerol 3-alpha-glucosyltransferase